MKRLLLFVLLAFYGGLVRAEEPIKQRRVLYNFDGDSCLSTKRDGKGPVAVTVGDVKRLIEEVAYDGSQVDTVLVCVNAQVMYYPTKVGTMRGTLSSADERTHWPASEQQRFKNLRAFFDAGVDPYAIMLAETKRRGREALLTFRMNDDHGNEFLRTQFRADHPEWQLGKGALYFGRDEVRDYTARLIEEAVRRYDCDGIELDFNRFPTFFKEGSTDQRVMKMNSLVERVRKLLDEEGRKRGRRLVLGVRVPSNYGRTPPTPESCRKIGCDVSGWAKNGWVDFVTVSEFLFEKYDLPLKGWKDAIHGVPVYGGIECAEGGKPEQHLTADKYRRAAARLWQEGADGVYLFNFFTPREYETESREPPFEVLKDLGDAKALSGARPEKPEQKHELGLVFSVLTWEGEYSSKDIPGGVQTTPVVGAIYTLNVDGTGLKKIVQLGKSTDFPTFSPDGKWVYFQSNATGRSQVYRCRPDGSDVANLTAGDKLGNQWKDAYGYALSRDGSRLLYTVHDGSSGRVVLAKPDGSDPRLLFPKLGYTYMGALSPTGDRVVVSGPARGYRLLIAELPEGEPRMLTPDHPESFAPQFTPDGKSIVFIRRDEDVYRVDADGQNLRRLTNGNHYLHFRLSETDVHSSTDGPQISPDGKRIAYVAVKQGVPNVCVMNLDGTGQRQITFRKTACGRARWSPDGQQIAFASFEGKYRQLFTVSVEGGDPRQLTRLDGSAYFINWKP